MNDKARQAFEDAGADLSKALTIDDLSEGDVVVKKTGAKTDDFKTVTVEGFEQAGYSTKAVLSDGEEVSESFMWDPDNGDIPHLAPAKEN